MDISYIKQMLILKIYMGERKGEGVRPKGGGGGGVERQGEYKI